MGSRELSHIEHQENLDEHLRDVPMGVVLTLGGAILSGSGVLMFESQGYDSQPVVDAAVTLGGAALLLVGLRVTFAAIRGAIQERRALHGQAPQ